MENSQASSSFQGYALDERRTERYTFTSMKALMRYFSSWMDQEDIQEVIDGSKTGFTIRGGCDKQETGLQMIKKCEYALVRMLRKGMGR
jgi:hypothetical protein